MLVVTQLATAAGATREQGYDGTGFTAYNNAQLHLAACRRPSSPSPSWPPCCRGISRSAHDGDTGAVRDDISQGLRTSAVAIVPIAFAFLALGVPMCTLLYGSSGASEAAEHRLHPDGLRPRA